MKTILEVLKKSSAFLEGKNIARSRRISEELIAHVLKISRLELYMRADQPLVEKELETLRSYVLRVSSQEPYEYVLGAVEFLGCKIKVDSRALIPRQETEILVDRALKEIEGGVVLDLCCGSGCIGIALKKANPDLSVILSDICPKALSLAKENAEQNEVDVEIIQGDFFEPLQGRKIDYLICNPPYLKESEYEGLDVSVKNFEPKKALVSGESGMEFYEKVAQELPLILKEKGKAFLEMSYLAKEEMQKLFPKAKIEHDWSDHPRFVMIEQSSLQNGVNQV